MEPVTAITLVTAAIPFVTAIFKKLFKTDKLPDQTRWGVNGLIPIVIGIVATGLTAHAQGMDWITSLAVGLGSGGAASSVRDLDKNLLGIVKFVLSQFAKDSEPAK